MCCGSEEELDLPPAVIEAIAGYRRLLGERGFDWGDDRAELFAMARYALLADVYMAYMGDWAAAIRASIADGVPPGTVVVRVLADGSLAAEAGAPRLAVPGRTVPVDVVVDSAAPAEVALDVGGERVVVAAGGAAVRTLDVDGAEPSVVVALGADSVRLAAVSPAPAGALQVTAAACSRWSVTDASGGSWFPDGVPRKWDVHGNPFFHAESAELVVPAGALRVVCARGLEFGLDPQPVVAAPGETVAVHGDPPRLFDPAAGGWYGGDLHVHLNYGGDAVRTPAEARTMQRGEGLHLMNLTAGNMSTTLVYDRELLETTAGRDLWSDGGFVARAGIEYRNDLLGHVHALGPSGPPARWQTGHPRGEHTADWPPNAVACADLRSLGATVGYAHPAHTDFADGSLDGFFGYPRSVEARELVADAALGLVDSIDVISPFHHEGAIFLYHRLLSCGLRLAATAGTDTFLSFARLGIAANPPGWGRVYADLRGEPLSVEAFQDAIRAGRTVVTNGPWLTLEVDGEGPGAVLDRSPGAELDVVARVVGPGAERLSIVGPDGEIAVGSGEVRARVPVSEPTWLAAIARGDGDPHTLDTSVLAHTSAVHVECDGARVARRPDARWCLTLLDRLETFTTEHAHFAEPHHRDDLADVIARAKAFYAAI